MSARPWHMYVVRHNGTPSSLYDNERRTDAQVRDRLNSAHEVLIDLPRIAARRNEAGTIQIWIHEDLLKELV